MKKTNKKSISISGIALILLTVLFGVGAAQAATFTVTNTADSGAGSLREAIASANATIDPDTITFAIPAYDPNCPGGVCTIALTSGGLAVNASSTAGALTINNSTGASNLLISGNNVSGVFYVYTGANLTLNAVTITNGYTPCGSGGINNEGILSVTNSIVSGNTGGSGGGIANEGGTLTLTNSTVSGNTARYGGGIISYGTATLLNSTVSGNTATDYHGGGIYNQGVLNLTSVTVAYNSTTNPSSTGGGIYNFSESYRSGTANLFNTIVANNTSAGSAPDFSGAISSASSFNLIGNGSGMTGITGGTNGNQVGIDPKLGSLANNGGTTQTHALLPGSPAIDQGSAAGTDQRGLTRPVDNPAITNAIGGNGADIGAFEVQTANAMPTTIQQCKNGGWLTFTMPRAFKNQGDCIQFVKTGK